MDERRRRRVLVGVMLSVFLAAMESTVVATAMPTVVASLGGLELYAWVFSGFLLTSTVTMPVWGRLSDILGRRSTFLGGLVVFMAGSALSGLAADMGQLIAFRMLQGLGAGSLMTIGMTIVGELFGLERRARMQGYISGVWGLASLCGPLVGGLLTDHVSWRWVFYINLPFGAAAMVLLAGALDARPGPARSRTLDYQGFALFAVGVSALLVGVLEAGRVGAWTGFGVVAPLAVAAAMLPAFVVTERRAAEPLVPLHLFASRMVLAAATTGFLAGMAMFGAISFVPLFLQVVGGMSATAAGTVLVPFVLGWVVMSVLSARLVLRVGYRTVVLTGMVCLTAGFVLLVQWAPGLGRVTAMRDAVVGGAGMGMIMVPMLIAVQSAVPRAELGAATSMIQFFRTVGGAIGLAVMGSVMAWRLGAGADPATALHAVFVTGLAVCVVALASAFLVPAGRARDLARPEARGEPARAEGVEHAR